MSLHVLWVACFVQLVACKPWPCRPTWLTIGTVGWLTVTGGVVDIAPMDPLQALGIDLDELEKQANPLAVAKARRGPKRKLAARAAPCAADAAPPAAEAITTREVLQNNAKKAREALMKRPSSIMKKPAQIESLPRELDGSLLDDLTVHSRHTLSKLSPIIVDVWKDLVSTNMLYRKQARSENSSHDALVQYFLDTSVTRPIQSKQAISARLGVDRSLIGGSQKRTAIVALILEANDRKTLTRYVTTILEEEKRVEFVLAPRSDETPMAVTSTVSTAAALKPKVTDAPAAANPGAVVLHTKINSTIIGRRRRRKQKILQSEECWGMCLGTDRPRDFALLVGESVMPLTRMERTTAECLAESERRKTMWTSDIEKIQEHSA